jgi:hypothetical protein
MIMIEVFKTNVTEHEQATTLLYLLKQKFPGNKINFDLHDCDKILRIDGSDYTVEDIMNLMNNKGFTCELLTA